MAWEPRRFVHVRLPSAEWWLNRFLSARPYSPAIPRIPCVSPETVLLDQVGEKRSWRTLNRI